MPREDMTLSTKEAYWRRHARRYDRVTLILNRRLPRLARRIAEDLNGRGPVLELAAGTGLLTTALVKTVHGLVATDRSEAMLEVLRARFGASTVEVRPEDALSVGSQDGSFEAVVAANLLHLLPEPSVMLREAARVLRTGGLLAVPTFAHGETLLSRFVSRLLTLSGLSVTCRFAGTALAELVRSAGFNVLVDDLVPGILPIRYVLARKEGTS